MMRNFVALVFLATSSSYGFVPRDFSPCLRPLSRGGRTKIVLDSSPEDQKPEDNPYNRPDPRDDEWRGKPFFLTPEEQERFNAEVEKEWNTDNGPEYYHYHDEIGAAIREENHKRFDSTLKKLLSALRDARADNDNPVAEDDLLLMDLWLDEYPTEIADNDKLGAEDDGTTTESENGGSGISASHNPYNRPDPRDDEWRGKPFFMTPEERERFNAELDRVLNTDNGPEHYHYNDEIGAAIREENHKRFDSTLKKLLSALRDARADNDNPVEEDDDATD